MAKIKSKGSALDIAFFKHFWGFYRSNRKAIRSRYPELTRLFLDHNDEEKNPAAFLRRPQFEALEMYVFLKERLDNAPVHHIFEQWYHRTDIFKDRTATGLATDAQLALLEQFNEGAYQQTFEKMKALQIGAAYPNYIYALTMGTGKTILMATCIFYEFLLANKYPKSKKYAYNALVFAPDKTVLQALREIQTFDRSRVIPSGYVHVLDSLISFHFLEDAGTTLNVLNGSRFNLIISNSQKIILKRKSKADNATIKLYQSGKPGYKPSAAYATASDLYDFDSLEDTELTTNQRFEKLRQLEQLAIYIDEAHHAFGKQLAKDMTRSETGTSLRNTVDELASELKKAGTCVVACHNFTGTPYADGTIFPEVMYAFGLSEAISSGYLKKILPESYSNVKEQEFVRAVLNAFFQAHPQSERFEGLTPKIAFFASTIEEVQQLRILVEEVLVKDLKLATTKVLVNVGDEKVTSDDDIREFNRLDTPNSEKQVILLVNKGKEGWNCRSLFGVALYREPKSKIFVLQATMRCLRSISPIQQTGRIYLSEANKQILDAELQQNFQVSLEEIRQAGNPKPVVEIHPVPPPRTVVVSRVQQLWQVTEKKISPGFSFKFEEVDLSKFQAKRIVYDGLGVDGHASIQKEEDITHLREKRIFSAFTLVAEIARYLNRSPIQIEETLKNSKEGLTIVVERINAFNELLYGHVIPTLFDAFYKLKTYRTTEEESVNLVQEPEGGSYYLHAYPKDVIYLKDVPTTLAPKSFHLDAYIFDSNPEKTLFGELLNDSRVKIVYFTGMLTHGQTDFYIQYIDPETHAVRSYYPDFLVELHNGKRFILEVKADFQLDDKVVLAKASATREMAKASGMDYRLVPSSLIAKGNGLLCLDRDVLEERQEQLRLSK